MMSVKGRRSSEFLVSASHCEPLTVSCCRVTRSSGCFSGGEVAAAMPQGGQEGGEEGGAADVEEDDGRRSCSLEGVQCEVVAVKERRDM